MTWIMIFKINELIPYLFIIIKGIYMAYMDSVFILKFLNTLHGLFISFQGSVNYLASKQFYNMISY